MRRTILAATLLFAATAQAQFQIQDSHTTASLRGIHSLGNGIAWASGTEGTILRTTDDGTTWQRCATPPDADKLDFRGIQAFDKNTAIVMSSGKGDLSRLYKTTDACKTWKLVFTNPDKDGFWDAIQFSQYPGMDYGNSQNQKYVSGYVLGDPVNGAFAVFQTRDGGETWSRRLVTKKRTETVDCKIDSFPAKDKEAAFAASNQALLGFGFPYLVFVTGGSVARFGYVDHFDLDFALCHDSAKFINLPLAQDNTSSGAFAVAARDNNSYFPLRLMVVGGDYQHPDSTKGISVFIATRDGFRVPFTSYFDTTTPATPPHGYRSSVAYDPTTKTWITVGPNGTDISRDDGKNWTALKPTPQDTPDADKNWNALSLPFVVGPKGRIGKLRPEALKP
jgi:hypothetical protein